MTKTETETTPDATPTEADGKLVSSLIKNAGEYTAVKTTFGLGLNTYSTVSKIVKPWTPSVISTRWEATEQYIEANHEHLVETLDQYADGAVTFVSQVQEARKKSQATEFILSSIEKYVQEDETSEDGDDEDETPEGETESPAVTSRVVKLGNNVTKKMVQKATEGLSDLRKRSSSVVHVDLMNYAQDFIDTNVKPTVETVSGLPKSVADKFTLVLIKPIKDTTDCYTSKVMTAFDDAQLTVKNNLIDPAMLRYEDCKIAVKDTTTWTETGAAVGQHVQLLWNDCLILPVTSYFEIESLKYSDVKAGVTTYASAKHTALKNTLMTALDSVTDKPVAELKWIEMPASVMNKLTTELSERYSELTGKELSLASLPLLGEVLLNAAKDKTKVYALMMNDYAVAYLPKAVLALTTKDDAEDAAPAPADDDDTAAPAEEAKEKTE